MTGWGTPAELINPAAATGKFLDQMVKVADWQIAFTVERRAEGAGITVQRRRDLRDSYQRATDIVASLDTTPARGRPAVNRSPWSMP